jgi:molecular chaperone Hsp33
MSGSTNIPAPPDSWLYTFVDEPREFALYFLEGQRLIQDLALLHPIRRAGFAYFRDVVLSVQPMIALLKHGEQFGFYIDSAEPFFRLKIETSHHGATRCTLVPEEFQEFPEAMRGMVRLLKLFPNQSLMLLRLPPPSGDDGDSNVPRPFGPRQRGMEQALERIFARALHDRDEIESAFAEIGFEMLARRQICFRCSCSVRRMIENVRLTSGDDFESLFDPDQHALDITCEYCKSRYSVTRDDLREAPNPIN